ncbi:Uncharacterized protein DBV15_10631 [Temnothorax longispinosus]|uniref:Uncharacterized protein n=1 Tax=Temnothorax longispinosus TaxID=300112 RepID=A0A4S2KA81_9HYME|nr:Uncharacterized protein DBV15_10631 [Temnothorax longispinosus]
MIIVAAVPMKSTIPVGIARGTDFPLTSMIPLVRHDNARHHGKCRLITPSAISRYKVDGRRALKPPLGPASTSRAGSPPFRFTVSHRLSPGDATRPAAGHEAGGRASRAERLANARKPRPK